MVIGVLIFPAERLVCAQVGNCVLVEINFCVTCCFCSLDLNSQLRIEDEALVDSVSGVIFVCECVCQFLESETQ